jgi:ABC-type multidrug transport system ATPase subunit
MRGRLTFARALLHRPEHLFLDEPTAGLDPVTARRVRQVIREARNAGATVFLTTHDMVTANELCDRVAFLSSVHFNDELHCRLANAINVSVAIRRRSSARPSFDQPSWDLPAFLLS